MAIVKRAPFGMLDDLRVVDRYLLVGNGGLTASILDYGATVQSLCFDGVDTVLGYDNLEGYLAGTSFQGASIGRYGNRIENSRFVIDGKTYTLAATRRVSPTSTAVSWALIKRSGTPKFWRPPFPRCVFRWYPRTVRKASPVA